MPDDIEPPKPQPSRKAIGNSGETGAIAFLESSGYKIVDVNVRPIGGRSRGEIDIIAWHQEILVFVEVKTRRLSRSSRSTPAEAVNLRKRRQLLLLAEAYILRHSLDDVPCRFDVVEVIDHGETRTYQLLVNAFDGADT
jgi:putative endonuclease